MFKYQAVEKERELLKKQIGKLDMECRKLRISLRGGTDRKKRIAASESKEKKILT